jgi:uncharacterized membrane protein
VRRALVALLAVVALATLAGLVLLWPGDTEPRLAQGIAAESERATVERVDERSCPGPGRQICRRLDVRLDTGPDEGRRVEIDLGASTQPDVDVGDVLRVAAAPVPDGVEPPPGGPVYTVTDFERRTPLLLLAVAFALLVVAFGRLRGALSLLGLVASLAVVLVFVVPAILDGKSPVAVAIVGSLAVALITIGLAHGGGPKSLAAALGTSLSLLLTAGLAVLFTELTYLTGVASEEAAFLQLSEADVSLDGLLLAGMVIAALGVLDDVTVSQASTVLALRDANPALRFGELFGRALRVGRDHVTATVNTLVLAYVGSSLPLLLVFSSTELGFVDAVSLELIAKEVVATLVGSIGLIAAVPITTALAAALAVDSATAGSARAA